MKRLLKNVRPDMLIFFALIAFVAFGNGMSDSVYSNYFKEAYNVDAMTRGFIELPREMPGLLCAAVIAVLCSMGDLKLAVVAQVLAFLGLMVLGLTTPAFSVMLVFLFVNSMGMHLFMPVGDAIGMSLAEPGYVGKRMGQYASLKSAVGFLAALLVFFGFRLGWFSFTADIKWVFVIGATAFALAVVAAVALVRTARSASVPKKKIHFVMRREYRYYYMLTVLHGVQKQIAFVYGSWVIVDLLAKDASVMALLAIVSSFICIFFMRYIGNWIDRFGIKTMMYVDALTFIGVYIVYGFVVWGITSAVLPQAMWSAMIVYTLFVMDRLSMQFGMVNAVYLRSIALRDDDVTATLSTGTSLDHVVSILAAAAGGAVWMAWGSQWVFFMAALFSLGNVFVAWRVQPEAEKAHAEKIRAGAINM